MTRITKMAPLFEGFVQEKEYGAILENINESVDAEIVEKYKTLSTEKQAAEAINELIDKKVSLEEFFATMSELKQGFKPKSGTELSDELTKALNRMTDTYKLLSEKNREIGKRIVEKIKGKPKATKASKVNESKSGEEITKEFYDFLKKHGSEMGGEFLFTIDGSDKEIENVLRTFNDIEKRVFVLGVVQYVIERCFSNRVSDAENVKELRSQISKEFRKFKSVSSISDEVVKRLLYALDQVEYEDGDNVEGYFEDSESLDNFTEETGDFIEQVSNKKLYLNDGYICLKK